MQDQGEETEVKVRPPPGVLPRLTSVRRHGAADRDSANKVVRRGSCNLCRPVPHNTQVVEAGHQARSELCKSRNLPLLRHA
jgi:hypothetical protein